MNLGICNNCVHKTALRYIGIEAGEREMCKYWKEALLGEMQECSEYEIQLTRQRMREHSNKEEEVKG